MTRPTSLACLATPQAIAVPAAAQPRVTTVASGLTASRGGKSAKLALEAGADGLVTVDGELLIGIYKTVPERPTSQLTMIERPPPPPPADPTPTDWDGAGVTDASGHCPAEPNPDNDGDGVSVTPESRAKNRRVEIEVR